MSEDRPVSAQFGEGVCFDYVGFLSASCKKRWRFVEAIYGVMPIFGMVLRRPRVARDSPKEQLNALALQVVSTQLSDETNIVRLITLAQQQGVGMFDIRLPYALSERQIAAIARQYRRPLTLSQQGERLSVLFPPHVAH
ncbi:hypothetical protein FJU30_06725 [Affinibrenneria salicis]|uniref:Uncharacterized protein n=1 Tax=Affinibrenneria salicis TaxID=2590031 RepID=A0A5J5G4I3_9GAMM|nr:hypothetical protein [Affinibrenneria salicis]KAA9001967.1 hypothetical protein FJU30_06725 [Affinibrenneria salicis]